MKSTRYIIPQDVAQYTVVVDHCVVVPLVPDEEIFTYNTTENSTYTNSTHTVTSTDVSSGYSVSTSNCPITLIVQEENLPSASSKSNVSCGDLSVCQLKIMSPVLDKWSYILIQIDNDYNVSEVLFKLHFVVKGTIMICYHLWNEIRVPSHQGCLMVSSS